MAWRNFCPGTVRFFLSLRSIGLYSYVRGRGNVCVCSFSFERFTNGDVCLHSSVTSYSSTMYFEWAILATCLQLTLESGSRKRASHFAFVTNHCAFAWRYFRAKISQHFVRPVLLQGSKRFPKRKKKSKAPSLVSLVCSSYDVISSRLISTITVNVLAANGTVGSPDLARGWMAILEIVSKIFPARIEN
jgi:hypothetical protein